MDQYFGGEKLLITIIFVGTIVLFCIVWTNRHISRTLLIGKKGPHTTVGNDASKEIKRKIERCIDIVTKLSIEPKLLSDQGCKDAAVMSSFIERRDDSTYILRRKAFDLMSCLNDLLCSVDICLAAKPGQSISDHMKDLQNPPYAPFLECKDLCTSVATLYEHARYSPQPFEIADYEQFAKDIQELTKKVYDRLQVPGSLIVPAKRTATEGSVSSIVSGGKSQGIIEFDELQGIHVVYRKKVDDNLGKF